MVIFHSYVSLPEGICWSSTGMKVAGPTDGKWFEAFTSARWQRQDLELRYGNHGQMPGINIHTHLHLWVWVKIINPESHTFHEFLHIWGMGDLLCHLKRTTQNILHDLKILSHHKNHFQPP